MADEGRSRNAATTPGQERVRRWTLIGFFSLPLAVFGLLGHSTWPDASAGTRHEREHTEAD